MRNGAREVDTIVGTLVRYRVHSNFILPQEQMGPWHLEGFVFVVASVRLHGARPWHLRKISGGFFLWGGWEASTESGGVLGGFWGGFLFFCGCVYKMR